MDDEFLWMTFDGQGVLGKRDVRGVKAFEDIGRFNSGIVMVL